MNYSLESLFLSKHGLLKSDTIGSLQTRKHIRVRPCIGRRRYCQSRRDWYKLGETCAELASRRLYGANSIGVVERSYVKPGDVVLAFVALLDVQVVLP